MATQQTPSNLRTPSKPSPHDSISMVRVIARVRPFLPHDESKSTTPCISSLDPSGSEVTVHLKDPHSSRNESYKVDAFYGREDKDVKEIFEREVMPLISEVVNGCNATVFAYGATGSGKTFIMQGNNEVPGLMPMATSTILSMCEKLGGKTVEISYYEIYMDRCYDLLEIKGKEIAVWDDKDGHPHLIGLSKIPIHSMLEYEEAFSSGLQRRKVALTSLNDASSRSHGVLVITVSDGPVIGKLNLIDLAGNEDNRRSDNEGVRLHESTKINQSLFALSQVIHALNNNTARIPYRDNKLTRILQDSLGGTSHAVMVACLNPGEYEQTVGTVSLAARSRRISNLVPSASKHNNTPKTQVDMEARLRTWLESKGKTKKPDTSTPCSINRHNTFKRSGTRTSIQKARREQKVEMESTPICKRKVLYPINADVNVTIHPKEHSIAADDTTTTPLYKEHSLAVDENTATPLSKFKTMSCNLKNTLAQEYINFLNTAGKMELQQLKGIGEKMADYIIELRDASPLKSLNDLENIGLSSKQVDNMFGRTAKGLFY